MIAAARLASVGRSHCRQRYIINSILRRANSSNHAKGAYNIQTKHYNDKLILLPPRYGHAQISAILQTAAKDYNTPVLKRVVDEGRGPPIEEEGLTNPRFKGDPMLEACYQNRRYIRYGSRGNAVAKIQSGITDYYAEKGGEDPLPVYGIDGIFGSETRKAVMRFQTSVGFVGKEVDGVIGHNTMDKLDKEVPAGEHGKGKGTIEKCMGCKPVASITKNDGNTTTVFGLCSDKFDVFNTGAGTSQVGPGCFPGSKNTKGVVNFRSGTKSGPAWQTVADIKDCTFPPPQANTTTPWEIGFIQTLESATYGAAYDNNHFTKVSNQNARDALTDKVPAPWYDNPGNSFGPQIYPTVPMINDTPNVNFPITHPDANKNFLRSVCMKGRFNIWLIINRKGVKPTTTNADFFYHWTIDIDQSHTLSGKGAHPCNQTQWHAKGNQKMSNQGPGKGSATLVWDKPITINSKVVNSTLKTNPCIADQKQKKNQMD